MDILIKVNDKIVGTVTINVDTTKDTTRIKFDRQRITNAFNKEFRII